MCGRRSLFAIGWAFKQTLPEASLLKLIPLTLSNRWASKWWDWLKTCQLLCVRPVTRVQPFSHQLLVALPPWLKSWPFHYWPSMECRKIWCLENCITFQAAVGPKTWAGIRSGRKLVWGPSCQWSCRSLQGACRNSCHCFAALVLAHVAFQSMYKMGFSKYSCCRYIDLDGVRY